MPAADRARGPAFVGCAHSMLRWRRPAAAGVRSFRGAQAECGRAPLCGWRAVEAAPGLETRLHHAGEPSRQTFISRRGHRLGSHLVLGPRGRVRSRTCPAMFAGLADRWRGLGLAGSGSIAARWAGSARMCRTERRGRSVTFISGSTRFGCPICGVAGLWGLRRGFPAASALVGGMRIRWCAATGISLRFYREFRVAPPALPALAAAPEGLPHPCCRLARDVVCRRRGRSGREPWAPNACRLPVRDVRGAGGAASRQAEDDHRCGESRFAHASFVMWPGSDVEPWRSSRISRNRSGYHVMKIG